MKISSNTSISYPTAVNGSCSKEVQSLMKLKQQLQDRIGQIKESQNDPKTKETMIKGLQEQIKEIDMRIHKLKTEELKASSEEAAQKASKEYVKEEETSELTLDTTYLVSAETNYSQLKTMKRVRTDLLNQARLASSSGKYPQAAKGIMDKVYKLENNMAEKIKDINEDLEKSSDNQKSVSKKNKDNETKEIEHDSNSQTINAQKLNNSAEENAAAPLEHVKTENQSSNDTKSVEIQRIDIKI